MADPTDQAHETSATGFNPGARRCPPTTPAVQICGFFCTPCTYATSRPYWLLSRFFEELQPCKSLQFSTSIHQANLVSGGGYSALLQTNYC